LPQLVIYSAKGAPDSCGPGCDRWIAIEGKIDEGAAARVTRFFREVKDAKRPVYFHSPGGEMRQAFAIGRLLRGRKLAGRVGRTVADACSENQTDEACAAIKSGHEDVPAHIVTRGAVCNSACSYLLFGTAPREVAPDAIMAVHSPKVVMKFRSRVTEKVREEATAKGEVQADRLASSYLAEMGISKELMTLVEAVSFESAHALTRQELYRFRIDTRDFVETVWTLENTAHPFVHKVALVKNGDGFRKAEWLLFCESKARARLMFVNEVGADATGMRAVAMVGGLEKPPVFAKLAVHVGSYDIWNAAVASDAIQGLFAVPHLEMGQNTVLPDGKTGSSVLEIETRGLESAWIELSATCPVTPARRYFPSRYRRFPNHRCRRSLRRRRCKLSPSDEGQADSCHA
jgi:hypothetical protein